MFKNRGIHAVILMKKKVWIIFLSLSCLFINVGHAGYLQTLKEKREKAIENMKQEQKQRQTELQNKKKVQMDDYLKSQSFYNRKIIFIISLSGLWIFICICSIFSKSNKKIN